MIISRNQFYVLNAANAPNHVTEASHLIGYAVALSGAVVQSLTFIMVRRIGGTVSFYTNVFYFGWCSALLSGFTMFVFQKPVIPDCGVARWFLMGVGKILMLEDRLFNIFLKGSGVRGWTIFRVMKFFLTLRLYMIFFYWWAILTAKQDLRKGKQLLDFFSMAPPAQFFPAFFFLQGVCLEIDQHSSPSPQKIMVRSLLLEILLYIKQPCKPADVPSFLLCGKKVATTKLLCV